MKKLLFLLILPFSFISCKKSTGEILNGIHNTSLITAAPWRLSYYDYSAPGIHYTFADLPHCKQDDQRVFNRDGHGMVDERSSKCNASDPQYISFNWQFKGEKAMVLKIDNVDYVIDAISETSLKYHRDASNPADATVYYWYTK